MHLGIGSVWFPAVTAAIVACSVGCGSYRHYIMRHSPIGHLHQPAGNGLFHCPRCGQITAAGGKRTCASCPATLVYHGYEATCWRQWPPGWGCPISIEEPIRLHAEGMIEGVMVENGPLVSDDSWKPKNP